MQPLLLLRPVHYSYRQLFRSERRLSCRILSTIITRLPSNAHSFELRIYWNYGKIDSHQSIASELN